MSVWRQLTSGLRVLVDRDAADRDVDEEVRHYHDELVAEHIARGLPPDAARRAARLEIGSAIGVREGIRASGWEHLITTIAADVRYALRQLRAEPAYATAAALTLAVGIGATTAIFSVVNGVLFEPLPYPRAEEIVAVWDRALDGGKIDVTFGTARELVARARSFDAIAVMKAWQPTLTGGAEPERLDGQRVSASYFRVLGVQPALGAGFRDSDDRPDGANVVVIADRLWRRRFGTDPTIVGRRIVLGDLQYTVTGVMPRGFDNVLSPSAEIWAPLQYDLSLPAQGREWGHHLRLAARLRHGVRLDAARRELDAIARSPEPEFHRPGWASLSQGLIADTLQHDLTAGVRPALVAVLAAVLLLLAIACVNVTNLVLARSGRRRAEMGLRAALGAGRARLVGQLLVESLVLAVSGGALGMLVAAVGVDALVAMAPPQLPRAAAIRLDLSVLAFAVMTTSLIGLVCGVVPALRAFGGELNVHLPHGSPRSTANRRFARRALVVGEVALALVLLVSAGLLFRSLQRLFAVAPGFEPSHLLTMQVQAAGRRFTDDDDALRRFFAQSLDAVRRVPGVAEAAFTSQLPLTADFEKYGVQFESAPNDDSNEDRAALRYAVTPRYFETMGHSAAPRPVARRARYGATAARRRHQRIGRQPKVSGARSDRSTRAHRRGRSLVHDRRRRRRREARVAGGGFRRRGLYQRRSVAVR
jgi:putative ABC transport system permease protein